MKSPRGFSFISCALVAAACLGLVACRRQKVDQKISAEATAKSDFNWYSNAYLATYRKSGVTDPKWDQFAENTLQEVVRWRSKTLLTNEDFTETIRTSSSAAVDSGCTDPLVRYYYVRFVSARTSSPEQLSAAMCDVSRDMQKSAYPILCKFYAALRAVQQLNATYGTNSWARADYQEIWQWVRLDMVPAIQDNTLPLQEVYDVCTQTLEEIGPGSYPDVYNIVEHIIFANWPNQSVPFLIKGTAHIRMAWDARGGGYISSVTESGAKAFTNNLAIAEKALTRAWELNPHDARIANEMLRVELGRGTGFQNLEDWFKKAMDLDPDDYDACQWKLLYLEPKWYGNAQAMLDFGRQCVENQSWGGRIPLVLVDAHYSICNQYTDPIARESYWQQPQVWRDVKKAYDRFFELNPDATDIYANYAWHAYHADQWAAFNELAPKVSPRNYSLFGGQVGFDKAVEVSKQRVK